MSHAPKPSGDWVTKRLLIYGTTYPEMSRTNFETVCTGALDLETGSLVRIYPVSLRYMEEPFGHYDVIEAKVKPSESDTRPESYKVDQQSIRKVDHIGAADGWVRRRSMVLSDATIVASVEALWDEQKATGRSLAIIKPREVSSVYARRKSDAERAEWEDHRKLALAVRDLWVDVEATTKDLVFMPVEYRMKWTCHGPACRGHDTSVLDWGIYVLSRKMFAKAPPPGMTKADNATNKVLEKLRWAFGSQRDPYLFMGNTKLHQGNFMVGGIFYPPSEAPAQPKAQLELL